LHQYFNGKYAPLYDLGTTAGNFNASGENAKLALEQKLDPILWLANQSLSR